MNTMSDWKAWHVFLSERSGAERYVCDTIAPLVARLRAFRQISGWFFIRYWEGGPHLRLRLRPQGDEGLETVNDALGGRIHEYVNPNPPSRQEFYANSRFDGRQVDVGSLPWYEEGSIVRIPYEPEIARYGGPHAMPLSEELFEQSSDVAISVISRTRGNERTRLAVSLEMMLAAVTLVRPNPRDLVTFFSRYADMWLWALPDRAAVEESVRTLIAHQAQHVRAVLGRWLGSQSLQDIGDVPDDVLRWREAVSRFLEGLSALAAAQKLRSPLLGPKSIPTVLSAADAEIAKRIILASQLHMLNNRLGIAPVQEYCIARLICSAEEAQG